MATKPNSIRQQVHLAVLVDADNAPAAILEDLFEEIRQARRRERQTHPRRLHAPQP